MGVSYSHYLIARDNTVRPQCDRIVALVEAWAEQGFIVRPDHLPVDGQHPSSGGRSKTGARFATEASYAPYMQHLLREQAPKPQTGFFARFWGRGNVANTPSPSPRPNPWMPFSNPPTGESLEALAGPYTLIRWDANSNATYPLQTVTENLSKGDSRFPHHLAIEISDDYINAHTDPYGGEASQVEPICKCGHNLEYEGVAGWLDTRRIRRVCPVCGRTFRPQDQVAEIRRGMDGTVSALPGGLCNRFAVIICFDKEMPTYRLDSTGVLIDATPKVTDAFLKTCTAALGIELNEFDYYS